MEFRILGPLEVTVDERALDLGGHKQRTLLALLLLEANRVVSSDRLIDALWEEEPPGTAQKALQVHVSQLRKLVGRDRLETRVPGYLLRVGPDELDLTRFERLQEEGRLDEGHQAILEQDPTLDLAVEAEATARPRDGSFVGREDELTRLLAGIEDACAGHARLFLLAGEPGVGKSRLAEELAARARDRGIRVLVGRCWEAGGAPAYWPWVQALRSGLRESEPETVRSWI